MFSFWAENEWNIAIFHDMSDQNFPLFFFLKLIYYFPHMDKVDYTFLLNSENYIWIDWEKNINKNKK